MTYAVAAYPLHCYRPGRGALRVWAVEYRLGRRMIARMVYDAAGGKLVDVVHSSQWQSVQPGPNLVRDPRTALGAARDWLALLDRNDNMGPWAPARRPHFFRDGAYWITAWRCRQQMAFVTINSRTGGLLRATFQLQPMRSKEIPRSV